MGAGDFGTALELIGPDRTARTSRPAKPVKPIKPVADSDDEDTLVPLEFDAETGEKLTELLNQRDQIWEKYYKLSGLSSTGPIDDPRGNKWKSYPYPPYETDITHKDREKRIKQLTLPADRAMYVETLMQKYNSIQFFIGIAVHELRLTPMSPYEKREKQGNGCTSQLKMLAKLFASQLSKSLSNRLRICSSASSVSTRLIYWLTSMFISRVARFVIHLETKSIGRIGWLSSKSTVRKKRNTARVCV